MNQEKLQQYIYNRIQINNNECWIPIKGKLSVRIDGIFLQGNRLSWTTFTGQILPKESEVYTLCQNTKCVNPQHLGIRARARYVDVHDRFWKFVNIKSSDECWEWMGSRNQDQYGRFRISTEKAVQAHRFAYEETNGPIPVGKLLCHTCDNPPCVNPNHLFIGSQSDNMSDMYKKKRHRVIDEFVGEKQRNAKLLTEDILQIRLMYHQGMSIIKINSKYPQISRAALYKIVYRKTWKHIE